MGYFGSTGSIAGLRIVIIRRTAVSASQEQGRDAKSGQQQKGDGD